MAGADEALARSAMYELLSLPFLYPEPGAVALLLASCRAVATATGERDWAMVAAVLAEVTQRLGAVSDEMLLNEYITVFGYGIAGDCPPYEGEYGAANIFQRSQTLASVNSFYATFLVSLNRDFKDHADHVSVELEFMHLLTLKEAYAYLHDHGTDNILVCRQAQQAFLTQHLAGWIKAFASRVRHKAGEASLYGLLARLLDTYMDREFESFQIGSPVTCPAAIPGLAESLKTWADDDQTCYPCSV